jgi:hypothetical protein
VVLLSALQRRRSTRIEGLWVARYRTSRGGRWSSCAVLDVSEDGVALGLPPNVSMPSGEIQVDLRMLVAPRRPLLVRGVVRNGFLLPDGWHRIGIELTNARGRRRRRLQAMLRRAER